MGYQDNLPVELRGLSEQERLFTRKFVEFGSGDAAKLQSGYSEKTDIRWLLSRPHIALAIRAEIVRQLATEGAQIGFGSLKRIARDVKLPAAAQVAAAKALLQGAGLLEPEQKQTESKPLTEYTQEELRDFIESKQAEIAKIEASLADRASIVGSGSTIQPIDPFE